MVLQRVAERPGNLCVTPYYSSVIIIKLTAQYIEWFRFRCNTDNQAEFAMPRIANVLHCIELDFYFFRQTVVSIPVGEFRQMSSAGTFEYMYSLCES